MLPNDRAQPAAPDKPALGARMTDAYRRLPIWLKVLTIIAAVFLSGPIILVAMIYGVVAVAQARRTVGASISVALWGVVVFSFAYKGHGTWLYSVILLPFLVALAAHAKPLARWFVPCRTVAWVLGWSVPAGVIALKAAPSQPFLGTIAAWLLAAAVLGWRVAKGMQDARMYGGHGTRAPGDPRTPDGPATHGNIQANAPRPPAGHQGQPAYSVRAQAAALPYADHAGRDHTAGPPRPRPQISVEDAMAELDAMIGLSS